MINSTKHGKIEGPMQLAMSRANILVVKDTSASVAVTPQSLGRELTVEEEQVEFARQQVERERTEQLEGSAMSQAVEQVPLINIKCRMWDYFTAVKSPVSGNTIVDDLAKEGYMKSSLVAQLKDIIEEGMVVFHNYQNPSEGTKGKMKKLLQLAKNSTRPQSIGETTLYRTRRPRGILPTVGLTTSLAPTAPMIQGGEESQPIFKMSSEEELIREMTKQLQTDKAEVFVDNLLKNINLKTAMLIFKKIKAIIE